MIQQLILNLTSLTLGIMIFFSFVVAPVTFKFLDEQNSDVYKRNFSILLYFKFVT